MCVARFICNVNALEFKGEYWNDSPQFTLNTVFFHIYFAFPFSLPFDT